MTTKLIRLNRQYTRWPLYNYYLYVLTNADKSAFYIGITSSPKRRLVEHQVKQTIPGCLRYSRLFYVGNLWKALTCESALHKMQNSNDLLNLRKICTSQESFWKWAVFVPAKVPASPNMRLPYLREVGGYF